MIMKAAGKLPVQLMAAGPHQLVEWFLTAVHEHDESIWRLMTIGNPLPFNPDQLVTVRLENEKVPNGDVSMMTALIPVKVRYYVKGERERSETWCFYLTRSSPIERWKISDIFVSD